MLIALLILMLFGNHGPEAMFAIPDLEERVTTTIPDLKKRSKVLSIVSRAKSDIGTANKRLGSQSALLMREQSEKITTSSELQSAFERLFLIRQELQFSMVDRDSEIRAALTDDEFKTIVVDGLAANTPAPEAVIADAHEKGGQLAQELADIRAMIEKHIADPDDRAQGVAAFDVFEGYMKALEDQDSTRTDMSDIYAKREVSRVVLEDSYSDMDNFRSEMFDRFIDMREVLVEVTTEDEWRPIANKLNVMFK